MEYMAYIIAFDRLQYNSHHGRYSDAFYCYFDMRNPHLGDNDIENLWNCYLYVHTMEI